MSTGVGRDPIGGEQVEGRRAVAELLRAGRRRVHTVLRVRSAQPDPLLDEIDAACREQAVEVRWTNADELARRARTDAPQGVLATADPLRAVDLDTLLARPDAFVVALDGVTDPRNLGAVMRAAETAGATGLVLPRHRSARITPAVTKASAGAVEYLAVAVTSGVASALERASRAAVWSIGLDERADTSVFDLDLADQPLILVFGSEGRGLARLTRRRCDVLARIPVRGGVASLNVSAAAAIACHEVARRRLL